MKQIVQCYITHHIEWTQLCRISKIWAKIMIIFFIFWWPKIIFPSTWMMFNSSSSSQSAKRFVWCRCVRKTCTAESPPIHPAQPHQAIIGVYPDYIIVTFCLCRWWQLVVHLRRVFRRHCEWLTPRLMDSHHDYQQAKNILQTSTLRRAFRFRTILVYIPSVRYGH